MIKKYFITGTDTNIGKTFVSRILLRTANKYGYQTAGYKPIASGNYTKKYGLKNKDAIILQENSSVSLKYKEVNPFCFYENSPPHILNNVLGKNINKQSLSLGLYKLTQKSNWILIEGAGGWYTPISYCNTFADWVQDEKLIVILIIGIKLGCINHAILTEKAILSDKTICAGWIANILLPQEKYQIEYMSTLLSYIQSPLLGIVPYMKNYKIIKTQNINIRLP
ncbi:dethiobiotin synthase [Buchnera aphidicola]|uniref:dethiobiotin synthase n=1 Tax=Buchnera aphidicola TaxID=9 RepID=UPI00346470AF